MNLNRRRRSLVFDLLELLSVVLFYGLVFSLLDKTWNPFTIKGLVLFGSMTFAYGMIGMFDDILQWLQLRKWGVRSEFSVRPTNFFLSIVSTSVSRLLSLVPGLMFGSPEAIKFDESTLSKKRNRTLIQISGFTYLAIAILAWLPTIGTTLIQRQEISDSLKNIIGGFEAFLLVIFAVAIETIFVQLLGFFEGLGQRMKAWNRWIWVISLILCTFAFLHTLLNPHYDFVQALQQGNTSIFIIVAISFISITFGLNLYYRHQETKKNKTK